MAASHAASSSARRVVLLTGCTGMAGTTVLEQTARLVRASRDAGHRLPFAIRAAVRNPSKIVLPGGLDAETRALDFGDAATFPAALEDVERVFVLFHPMYEANIPPFLDACREAAVKHVVMMTVIHAEASKALPHFKAEKKLRAACDGDSSAFERVEPLPALERTTGGDLRLWEDEDITATPDDAAVRALTGSAPDALDAAPAAAPPADDGLGMTFTIVRPSWFMDNLVRPGIHLPDILETGELYMPAGRGRVHLVHGSDVAEVIARLCMNSPDAVRPAEEHRNVAYAVTSAENPTVAEMAETMTEVLGRPIKYTAAWTVPFMWHMTRKRGHSLFMAALMSVQYGYSIAGGHSETLTPTISSLLGGRAPRDFRTFLAEQRAVLAPGSE